MSNEPNEPDYSDLVPNPEGLDPDSLLQDDAEIHLSTIRKNLRDAAGRPNATDITKTLHRVLEAVLPTMRYPLKTVRQDEMEEAGTDTSDMPYTILDETEASEADEISDNTAMEIFERVEEEFENELGYWLFRAPNGDPRKLQEFLDG